MPALGVGRNLFWFERESGAEYGYVVAAGDSEDGHWELRATHGQWLGTSAWLNGTLRSSSGGPDESLHGIGTNGPRYLGYHAGTLGPRTFFVFGEVANEVARVESTTATGETIPTRIASPPEEVETDLRFYYAVTNTARNSPPLPLTITAYDANGNVLQRQRVPRGSVR